MLHATWFLGNRHLYFRVSTYSQDGTAEHCCKACCTDPRKILIRHLDTNPVLQLLGRMLKRKSYSSQLPDFSISKSWSIVPDNLSVTRISYPVGTHVDEPVIIHVLEFDITGKPQICRRSSHLRTLLCMSCNIICINKKSFCCITPDFANNLSFVIIREQFIWIVVFLNDRSIICERKPQIVVKRF